jgi:hypothetical protein
MVEISEKIRQAVGIDDVDESATEAVDLTEEDEAETTIDAEG